MEFRNEAIDALGLLDRPSDVDAALAKFVSEFTERRAHLRRYEADAASVTLDGDQKKEKERTEHLVHYAIDGLTRWQGQDRLSRILRERELPVVVRDMAAASLVALGNFEVAEKFVRELHRDVIGFEDMESMRGQVPTLRMQRATVPAGIGGNVCPGAEASITRVSATLSLDKPILQLQRDAPAGK